MGLEGDIFFLEISFLLFGGSSEAAIGEGGGARSAPLCKLVSSKRRVRKANGRARAAKTH